MTPITLLTKGHTIQGMRNERTYRLTKHTLPKFAPTRPVELRVEMEPAQQPLQVPLKQVEKIVEQKAEEAACPVPRMGETKAIQEAVTDQKAEPVKLSMAKAETEPVVKAPEPVKLKVKLARGGGIWRLLLERITFRRRPVRVKTVQTELALERVAVVRNDLSDDDLEVRPKAGAKKRGANPFGGGKGRVQEAKEETATGAAFAATAASQPAD